MTQNKTQPTEMNVADFITAIDHDTKRGDAMALDQLFRQITGCSPVMWGPSIVGYGRYHYKYASGREGDYLATGFSPRKANFSIYVMPGYQDYSHILWDLGKHKIGKSCLYINKLADIDLRVLERLIRTGLADLAKMYPVEL